MTKQNNQYKAGTLIQQEAGDNTRFAPKAAQEAVEEIARKLFGLWDWLTDFRMVNTSGSLQAYIDRWLYPQVPAPAYIYVPISTYRERK